MPVRIFFAAMLISTTTLLGRTASSGEVDVGSATMRETAAEFGAQMDQMRGLMEQLRAPRMDIGKHLDAIASDDGKRGESLAKVVGILQERVAIAAQLLQAIDSSARLYDKLGVEAAAEKKRLVRVNRSMTDDLKATSSELSNQVKRLNSAINMPDRSEVFREFTQERTDFVKSAVAKLREHELPSLDDYFARWREIVRTRMLADQQQVLNYAFYANAFNLIEGRNHALAVVSGFNPADYLKDLAKSDIDAANMATVLNAAFGDMIDDVYELPGVGGTEQADGFQATIMPDRGLGGVYYYSEQPDGLREPTIVKLDDGRIIYAERIRFTVHASRDCYFVMHHVGADGKTQVICPNRYAADLNRLDEGSRLTIPSTQMPFEFAATEPAGVETVRLIITPTPIVYDHRSGHIVECKSRGDHPEAAAFTVQPRTNKSQLRARDRAFFDDHAAGNAVAIETFIRIKKK